MGRPARPVVDSVLSFWAKVERAPGEACWEWKGSRDVTGYGIVRIDGQLHKAHRVAWVLANGRPPGLRLRHVCGNASCVRPAHLASRS